MITAERIRELTEQKIAGTDMFIVEIKVLPVNRISVRLDRMEGGIVVSDCAEVSRHIEAGLDRDAEDFSLEVSSAGLEEPFRVKQQYLKNRGRRVEVLTFDGLKRQGRLQEADETGITLEVTQRDRQLKKDVTHTIAIQYDQIKQTKKVVSFK
ncbi:MAG: ribosome assembly cofactor RimP [Bacteroidota bacterium]